MNSSTFCSLFLGLILISQSYLLANAGRGNGVQEAALFDSICAPANNETCCLDFLRSNPEIVKAKNLMEISKIVLKIAIDKAVEGQNFLKELAAKTNSPALKQCGFDYDSAVRYFKGSLEELLEDADETAGEDAKVAGDYPDRCDREMESEHLVNPQVTALNRQISFLSEMAFLATYDL